MSTAAVTYNVLIQVKTQNESEEIISTFRSAGMAVRAHRVTSEQDFIEHLSEDWDLLIVDNKHPEVSIQFSVDTLQKHNQEISLILLTEDTSPEGIDRGFKLGVNDVINKKDTSHFTHAAKREMDNTLKLREFSVLKKEFDELTTRAEQLLSESDDAICYVSDGIIMQVNQIFAEAFGYDDIDELDCASIIDLVADKDQDKFKNFFKHFTKGDIDQTELAFTGVKKSGEEFASFLTLHNSKLDGEPCTQVNITASSEGGGGSGTGTVDAATELNNRYYLHEQLTTTAIQVGKTIPNAALLVYSLDDFEKVLDDVYFSGVDLVIKDLAGHLGEKLEEGEIITRLGTDAVGVISHRKTEDALEFAKSTIKTIEDHILEMPGKTIQYTCTCAVLNLNNKDATIMIDNGFEGISHLRLEKERNSAGIFTPVERQAPKPGADDIANIEEALELGSFKLLYQPMMSLQGDEMENYEVSVWLQDGDKDIYPEEMIKSAKNSKLDRWIILESTKSLSAHRAGGHNTRLLINLTQNALKDDGLAAWLGVAIKAANLSNEHVIFQFDELDVKNNLKSAIKTITGMTENGFKVSLTHFGKESEPFKVTKHFKLDFIRIDEHFTESLASGDTSELKEIVDAAKENSIKTILPEVDNAGALATLWQLGTHYIQGSYLQNPSPVMEYEFTEIA